MGQKVEETALKAIIGNLMVYSSFGEAKEDQLVNRENSLQCFFQQMISALCDRGDRQTDREM